MQLAVNGALNFTNPTITTASTGTVTLFNTNATTVNAFGAATTMNIGGAGTTTYIGANTGNTTLSLLGNGTTGTATITTNAVSYTHLTLPTNREV